MDSSYVLVDSAPGRSESTSDPQAGPAPDSDVCTGPGETHTDVVAAAPPVSDVAATPDVAVDSTRDKCTVEMISVETQTSDQRIILTKALLVAQTRAKEYQEALDSYDVMLVEAVVQALRKVETPEFIEQISREVGFTAFLEQEYGPSAVSTTTGECERPASPAAAASVLSPPALDAAGTARDRLLRQLDRLEARSRRFLETQHAAAATGAAAAAAAGAGGGATGARTSAASGCGAHPVRPLLGLAARAALAQRRAECERARARHLQARLAALQKGPAGSLQRALHYLRSVCSWLLGLCSQLAARVVRTLAF